MKRMRILLIVPTKRARGSRGTVTNLTRGQTFTPVLVASRREGVTLFTLGDPASSELATLAEEGATAPLAALLLATPGVRYVADSGASPAGFVLPGQSKAIVVGAGRGAEWQPCSGKEVRSMGNPLAPFIGIVRGCAWGAVVWALAALAWWRI